MFIKYVTQTKKSYIKALPSSLRALYGHEAIFAQKIAESKTHA